MITNAGYNSFHECVYGGVPAIFVPNQSPEMDDQHLRATYAYASGLGLRLRASETSRAEVDRRHRDVGGFRYEMRRRSARLTFVDGAAEAARGDRTACLLGESRRSASRGAGEGIAASGADGDRCWRHRLICDEIVEAHVELDLLRKVPFGRASATSGGGRSARYSSASKGRCRADGHELDRNCAARRSSRA